ncbi:aminotransferase class IV [Thiotrichales bacterium 19S3-7]|nr:aminotransferase class IV [Thiotrichales bacterium 19S3-7]MCF6801870.1 aminotransferase class IV [Thiotrichales bacterium 19S3-11]
MIVYLNNEYLPLAKAKVSVMDRGFLFADGVYEVITLYQGKPFHIERHVDRLKKSLKSIYLDFSIELDQIEQIINKLIELNGNTKVDSFYLQITRGAAETRTHHHNQSKPTVFAYTQPIKHETKPQGIKLITVNDIRWHRCDIKSINRLANVIMSQQAKLANAEDALIINKGKVFECATSNIFIVENDTIFTPPLTHDLLGGITREVIIKISGSRLKIEEINLARLLNADEVWISSSTREIMAVTCVDNQKIASGEPGLIYKQTLKAYRNYIDEQLNKQ